MDAAVEPIAAIGAVMAIVGDGQGSLRVGSAAGSSTWVLNFFVSILRGSCSSGLRLVSKLRPTRVPDCCCVGRAFQKWSRQVWIACFARSPVLATSLAVLATLRKRGWTEMCNERDKVHAQRLMEVQE